MAEAKYFHSTLYCFVPAAYNEVVRRFGTSMQDVSARCWYDTAQDIFCLTSPTAIGQRANSCLNDVLCSYIDDELAAAERQDRAPLIKPFAGGVLEHEVTCVLGDNDLPGLEASTQSLNSTQGHYTAANITVHTINLEQSTSSHIKLFLLGQLPTGLVDRILCSTENDSKKAIQTGVTARTVRWDAASQVYVFNGRVGSPIHVTNPTNGHLLYETRFNSVSDLRTFEEPFSQFKDIPVQHWDFPPGETVPDFNRFLEGMGETVMVDPNTKPDMPEDAAKFLSESTHPQLSQGRRRVPAQRKATSSSNASDSDSDDDNRSSTTTRTNNDARSNKNNVRGAIASRIFGPPTNSNQDLTPKDTNLFQKPTDYNDRNRTPTMSNPLPVPYNSSPGPSAKGVGKVESQVPLCSSRRENGSNMTNSKRSSNEDDKLSTEIDDFPTWEGKYAAVDRIGLAGVAPNQATWEHVNDSSKEKKSKKSGISLRQSSTQSRTTTPVLSAISEAAKSLNPRPNGNSYVSTGTSSSSYSSTSTGRRPQASTQSTPQKWANRVVLPKAGEQTLINVTAGIAAKPLVKPPRGLLDSATNPVSPSTAVRHVTSPPANSTQSSDETIKPSLLDDVSEIQNETEQFKNTVSPYGIQGASSFSTTTPVYGASTHQLLCQIHSQDTESSTCCAEEDDIIERLQVLPHDSKCTRYTMNQKARKPRDRKRSKQPGVNKAVLPKPNPVPSVPSKKPPKEAEGNNSKQPSKPLQELSKSPPALPGDEAHQSKKPSTEPMNALQQVALQQVLSHITARNGLNGTTIQVRFGMILLQQQLKQPFQTGAVTKNMLLSKLQLSEKCIDATFFQRLTTSTSDALYLLDLVPGSPVSATTQYEVLIKNAEGALRTIKMNGSDKASLQVTCPPEPLGTHYMHYPMHIWDAKATVEKAKFDNSMDGMATEFVSSMQTVDQAPSFMAMVPSGSFGIDRVYAKRIFSKLISNAVEFSVIEVQDLALESVNNSRYNFKAIGLAADEMVTNQRLWWECELGMERVDDEMAVELQSLTDRLVSAMDGVGYANKGPWEKTGVDETQNGEQWFW